MFEVGVQGVEPVVSRRGFDDGELCALTDQGQEFFVLDD